MKTKRILLVITTILLALVCFCACDNNTTNIPGDDNYCTVTFKFNNEQADYAVQVQKGSLVSPPISPERSNYIFNGWKNDGKIWDFTKDTVRSDVLFTAQWIDASSVFSYSVNTDGTATVTAYKGSLTEIRIPEVISGLTVTAIGDGTFKNLDDPKATLITIPKTITSVGNSAFAGCNLTPITVLGELTHVGEGAFDGCAKLTSPKLGETATEIPFRAFADCTSVTEATIPKNITAIEEDAFEGCTSLQSLIVMSTDFSVQDSAFAGCDKLVTVFYIGNAEQWQTVLSKTADGGNGNDNLINANVFFYSESKPETDGDFWHFNENGEPRCW